MADKLDVNIPKVLLYRLKDMLYKESTRWDI